jgi:hypothetical protein
MSTVTEDSFLDPTITRRQAEATRIPGDQPPVHHPRPRPRWPRTLAASATAVAILAGAAALAVDVLGGAEDPASRSVVTEAGAATAAVGPTEPAQARTASSARAVSAPTELDRRGVPTWWVQGEGTARPPAPAPTELDRRGIPTWWVQGEDRAPTA